MPLELYSFLLKRARAAYNLRREIQYFPGAITANNVFTCQQYYQKIDAARLSSIIAEFTSISIAGDALRRKNVFVLLVEDNSTFRNSLKEMLASRFPRLLIGEASDGDEALQKLESANPDLIFMDIRLPGKNGLEVTRIIKEIDSSVHVVILTSYDIPEYREAAFRSGASQFFTKGDVGSDEIANFVRSALLERGKDPDNHAGIRAH